MGRFSKVADESELDALYGDRADSARFHGLKSCFTDRVFESHSMTAKAHDSCQLRKSSEIWFQLLLALMVQHMEVS